MQPDERTRPLRLYVTELLYLSFLGLLSCVLYLSRADEIYSVWGAIHPMFWPLFITATILLLIIIFTPEKIEYKLLFIILHSIISHSLFAIIFPAGRVGVQQTILGRTRLVFDDLVYHGLGWGRESILQQIYASFRGINLQAATSTIFARMFGIDVYWIHLLLVPVLWGTFVPFIAFMISKTLGLKENIAALSGVLVSLFPTSIVWGYESIPNALGYLFFFCFMYFLLKYLQSSNSKELLFLVLVFLAICTLSHFLTGTVALSLLMLSYSMKVYLREKERSPLSAKFLLSISFIFCVSILPLALAYRRLFYPTATTAFSLNRFRETPLTELILPFLLGSYFDLISRNAIFTTLIFGVAPLCGLIGMIYIIGFKSRKMSEKGTYPLALFLFLGFLLIVGDDRIVKFFMVRPPFLEIDRLWVFRDLMLTPYAALLIHEVIIKVKKVFSKLSLFKSSHSKRTINFGSILVYSLAFILLSGWITMSVYYAYPSYGPLHTTTYEIEAVKFIDQNTHEKYIVIADQWIIFAGQMFVGINNPNAFYFSHVDPCGVGFFIDMKNNPSNKTLSEAMKTNNATVAYFIIEKPRLGTETYNQIIQRAQQNGVEIYRTFSYKGEEKLRIFYHVKE